MTTNRKSMASTPYFVRKGPSNYSSLQKLPAQRVKIISSSLRSRQQGRADHVMRLDTRFGPTIGSQSRQEADRRLNPSAAERRGMSIPNAPNGANEHDKVANRGPQILANPRSRSALDNYCLFLRSSHHRLR
jgi:hypothetical protein